MSQAAEITLVLNQEKVQGLTVSEGLACQKVKQNVNGYFLFFVLKRKRNLVGALANKNILICCWTNQD